MVMFLFKFIPYIFLISIYTAIADGDEAQKQPETQKQPVSIHTAISDGDSNIYKQSISYTHYHRHIIQLSRTHINKYII